MTREDRLRAAICDELPTYLTREDQVHSVLRMLAKDVSPVEATTTPPAPPELPISLLTAARSHKEKAQRRRPPLKGRTKVCPICNGQGYIPNEGSCGFCFGRGKMADPEWLPAGNRPDTCAATPGCATVPEPAGAGGSTSSHRGR